MEKQMELYYKNSYSNYQREIKGIKKIIKIQRQIKKFIKSYCSDYFSLSVNVFSLMWFAFTIFK